MRECRPYGSVRGARSNARPYRDQNRSTTPLHTEAVTAPLCNLSPPVPLVRLDVLTCSSDANLRAQW
jgi:hypothetical protein